MVRPRVKHLFRRCRRSDLLQLLDALPFCFGSPTGGACLVDERVFIPGQGHRAFLLDMIDVWKRAANDAHDHLFACVVDRVRTEE